MIRVLLIDDEENLLVVLADELLAQGYEVFTASDPEQGVSLAFEVVPDVIVTDLRMGSLDGIAATRKLQKELPEIPVLVLTAIAEIKTAVEAMRAGAVDYLTKPADPEALSLALKRAVREHEQKTVNVYLRDEVSCRLRYQKFSGQSEEAQQIRERIQLAATSDAPVVISGETGTGKELVARLVHRASKRADRPFLVVNCREESEEYLLAELFGRVARGQPVLKSKLEIADGGSLLFDELPALSPDLQASLRRTVETGLVEPGGGRRAYKVDVRFFFSSTEDLQEAATEGKLLPDLYHQINVISLALPRLSERRSDIPLLAEEYLQSRSSEFAPKAPKIDDSALEALSQYEWPGNVRELFNVLEGALVMSLDRTIKVSDLPTDLIEQTRMGQGSGRFVGLREKLLSEERRLITRALEKNGYIQLRAARALGISRSLLNQKIKRLQIEMPSES